MCYFFIIETNNSIYCAENYAISATVTYISICSLGLRIINEELLSSKFVVK